MFFFFQAEDGIRDHCVTGVQTCALPISGTVSGWARTSRTPSQRSIRSSPERLNSSSEPAMSSGAGRPTRNLVSKVNATQRSGPHGVAQFVQPQADATLDRPQRQAGLAGDLLVRLTADIRAPNQVGVTQRQSVA